MNFLRLLFCVIVWISLLTKSVTGSVQKLPKLCLKLNEGPRCEERSSGAKIICRKDYKSHYHKEYWKARTVIVCMWSEWYISPDDLLTLFPLVQKLIIRNGNVSQFLTDFPESDHLETLILRDLHVEELRPTLLSSLSNLKYLDLRNNRLKNLNPHAINGLSLSKIVLTDNPWDCRSDLKWTLKRWAHEKLFNIQGMFCADDFYAGKPVISVMYLIQAMESECPQHICSCSMLNIVWDTNKSYLVPVITVNCSGRGLIELPEKLPRNTTTLILKWNNITDLSPLANDRMYINIVDVYLDHNSIENIGVLEGALWLTKFRVLSLKGNYLKELPTYALDNAFERNTNMAEIYLGSNPWKCDCMFTSEFQHILIKYRSIVKDRNDIRCDDRDGGDRPSLPILDISISSVCASSTDGINPLDIVSGVLALLIILVIGKLIYDYWTFKRTGKLPWLVAKMP